MKRLAVAAALVIAYSWWVTGVAPFTSLAYTLIALPSIAAVALYASMGAFSRHRADLSNYYQFRARHVSFSNAAPWLVVLVSAVALEAVGLSLGGRSPRVPTLSTTVDHLLEQHWERGVLFFVWLVVGATPLWRLWQHQPRDRT